MPFITTSDGTEIFYRDWGPRDGQTIVFHHGWPLSADDWDNQMLFFHEKGYRVIAHDRRGHGRSAQTADGNNMEPMPPTSSTWRARSTSGMRSISAIRQAAAKSRAMSPAQKMAVCRGRS
jgi:pimeloyl-ACP methyl ester carboxylesterase